MQKRHLDKYRYFNEQAYTTRKYVISYIENYHPITENSTILEIGCGEGGNLLAFMDLGCSITGIDLSEGKIIKGNEFYKEHKNNAKLTLICDDIYNRNDLGTFDVIILRDVIEHIPNQEKFMHFMQSFLGDNSIIFFGFPPWQNPFGGHQQMCVNKFLSKLPYFHLLPKQLYKSLLHLFNEPNNKIEGLLDIKATGISIERFEKIVKQNNYSIKKRTLYFINPNYEVKFGLKPRKQIGLISSIPWIRNFLSTAVYYLVSKNNETD